MPDARPVPCSRVRLGEGLVLLADLRGVDERAVAGTGTRDAIDLVDRLLADGPGVVVAPGQARELTAAERDRLLAHVHQRAIGDRIATSSRCHRCDEQYDLDFRLDDLVAGVQPEPPTRVVQVGGRDVRVPTGVDELALEELPPEARPEALLARLADSVEGLDAHEVSQALEAAAPVLDVDLDGTCPACGAANQLRFSMQHWLLGTLLQGQDTLWAEVHLLARAYGWGLSELLDLTRPERKRLVRLVDEGRP